MQQEERYSVGEDIIWRSGREVVALVVPRYMRNLLRPETGGVSSAAPPSWSGLPSRRLTVEQHNGQDKVRELHILL